MTQKELIIWFRYVRAINKPQTYDNYMEREDKRELVRLNHLIMEIAHNIHNKNMLNDL